MTAEELLQRHHEQFLTDPEDESMLILKAEVMKFLSDEEREFNTYADLLIKYCESREQARTACASFKGKWKEYGLWDKLIEHFTAKFGRRERLG